MKPNVKRNLSKYVYGISTLFVAAAFITPTFTSNPIDTYTKIIYVVVAFFTMIAALLFDVNAERQEHFEKLKKELEKKKQTK